MKYRTIVADPPWSYPDQPWGKSSLAPGRSFLPYPTMESEEIAAISVNEWADRRGAHLYLWTTHRFLLDAHWIAEAWGFRPVCVLAWCKKAMPNAPGTFKSTLEFVVFARRGNLPALSRVESQWFEWPRGQHSAKPEAFLDLVETVSPGPYLELFARRQRLGWDTWGNEALEHVSPSVGAALLVEEAKKKSNEYRIEADCAMRDYETLEMAAQRALDHLTVVNRRAEWQEAKTILEEALHGAGLAS